MLISLVGMSGSGKSYWSAKLAESGFIRFCCDDMISEKLSSELHREDGGAMTLGEWMGFPFDPGYEEREELYLSREKSVMAEVMDAVEKELCAGVENVVVDTTGSVIYTGTVLLAKLRSLTTTVHFTVPLEVRETMLRAYLENPRPVLWRGLFSRNAGESREEALFRSYNLLLDTREKLYRELADVEIDYFRRSRPGFGVRDFLAIAGKATELCPPVSE